MVQNRVFTENREKLVKSIENRFKFEFQILEIFLKTGRNHGKLIENLSKPIENLGKPVENRGRADIIGDEQASVGGFGSLQGAVAPPAGGGGRGGGASRWSWPCRSGGLQILGGAECRRWWRLERRVWAVALKIDRSQRGGWGGGIEDRWRGA